VFWGGSPRLEAAPGYEYFVVGNPADATGATVGTDAYKPYIYSLAPLDSVATLVFKNRAS
jgi:hypothetical protein